MSAPRIVVTRRGESLRVVANAAVGYDNVDVAAATRRGGLVTNTPGVLADATADLAIALMLAVTRRLGEGERLVRGGEPWRWDLDFMLGTELRDRLLGIVGLGAIGTAVARRARAFGMRVCYSSRSLRTWRQAGSPARPSTCSSTSRTCIPACSGSTTWCSSRISGRRRRDARGDGGPRRAQRDGCARRRAAARASEPGGAGLFRRVKNARAQ